MKKNFSVSWKASKQARKQRKYSAEAPLHIKQKMLAAHLSKELRQKYSRRAFVLKRGDTVKVMKGEFRGKTGKIGEADIRNSRVTIEGMQITKKEGSKVNVYFRPSNLMITELVLDDKKRENSIKRKVKTEIKTKEKS